MPRLDMFAMTPATLGFLKYRSEAVKIAMAIISNPVIKPKNPIISPILLRSIISPSFNFNSTHKLLNLEN